jgi:multiple sugar transport system permease protein
MLPRLWDSVVVAVGSTLLTVAVADACGLCAVTPALSRPAPFVFWILSTRMMPPVACRNPMFFIYKGANLLDTYTGLILVHAPHEHAAGRVASQELL